MANRYWKLNSSGGGKAKSLKMLVSEMTTRADAMLTKLIANKDYQDRTGNLVSSYAYAIFYDGNIIAKQTSPNVATMPNKGYNASEEINKAINERLALADKSRVVLVIFAAMFYGAILEKGIGVSRKYAVIKDIIRDDVSALATSYKGNIKEYG